MSDVAYFWFLNVFLSVTPTLHFVVGEQFPHLGHVICSLWTPATNFAFHTCNQPLCLVAFHATQSTSCFRCETLAHTPIQSPFFLGNLFYSMTGSTRTEPPTSSCYGQAMAPQIPSVSRSSQKTTGLKAWFMTTVLTKPSVLVTLW